MKKCLLLALLILSLPLGSNGSAALEDINPFVRGSWKHILNAHAGQPMVVHFWGVTCGPCRVEMPRWGELLKKRPDLNLVPLHSDYDSLNVWG
jgi:thiol-disulfide isomerase/thioredoxin